MFRGVRIKLNRSNKRDGCHGCKQTTNSGASAPDTTVLDPNKDVSEKPTQFSFDCLMFDLKKHFLLFLKFLSVSNYQ